MEKPRFDADFEEYYNTCLADLKARPNFTEAWIPQLERFVTITAKLAKLNCEILDEEVTVDHTNKANKTNKVTSPAWRMFIVLDSQANALADKLRLSPHTAPVGDKKPEKKGFDLTPMKVAK